ncbi:hypothetical protein KY290_011760 [Solanum tuberosum]|uniref:White-brown-complex ABC transporter family n=1 Tax=Solanum tuberosum TaxID=4113 RepID=A0ABQ7W1K6_SOLTU|nr:hypothetical protein KY284_011880 [Solanum tuberosum]KAH0774623.1 hypothetical protein KY290_011760 [Solanum tuberosum]
MASAIMGPSGSGKTTLLNVLAVVLIHKLVMQKFVELVFGEKKRMSLACELIASPSVVFADEPATGLDAFQAEQVMETLRYLAQDRHTVICSIHHSRGSVYAKFDDVVLLAGGSLINAGPANDEVQAYFSKFGHCIPGTVAYLCNLLV